MIKFSIRLPITFFLIAPFFDVFAQSTDIKALDQGYYVIVGAFKIPDNAKRYAEVLAQRGTNASYGSNQDKEMHYVFTGKFSSLETATQEVTRIRKDTAFHDAWIKSIGNETQAGPPEVLLPTTSAPDNIYSDSDSTSALASRENEIIIPEHVTLENTEVFLSLFNATNNRVINGNVKVIDAKKNKQVAEVAGNEYLKLPASVKGSEKLILICEITGYRKIQMEINYRNPLEETENAAIELFGTTVLVNFDMVPYVKGDIVTLYNVYFFNDASIMRPESQYELNQVVQMMKDNPQQRIRLHGHTNGNYTGQIISLGPERNYFSLESGQNHFGTARQLAEERASIIKEYLIDNNIDKSRIEIKAWGGKRPLYDKHSMRAKMNVRVEVEVL